MRYFICAFIIFLSSVNIIQATVLINEISPSTNPEWIELYNDGETPIDLTNYLLEDGNTSHTDDLVLTGAIPGHGYLVFSHSEGWLNNSGDTLKLYDAATPSANIIDQYTYSTVSSDKSIYRSPDGSETWVLGTPTVNLANPTPTPSLSPSPSPTSTPTPTPSPSLLPSPTPTPTPKPSIKPIPSPDLSSPVGTIAGESTEIDLSGFGVSPSPAETLVKAGPVQPVLNQSRLKTVLFIGSGLIIVALASFLGYRRYLATKGSDLEG